MPPFSAIISRGIGFVRANPQIIYTLFLVIAIPFAFFFTSEQFLKIARENQDRLERNRVTSLSDAFVVFLPDHLDPAFLHKEIVDLSRDNDTINTFQVVVPAASSTSNAPKWSILASLRDEEMGGDMTPDDISAILMRFARADMTQTFTMPYNGADGRHFRGVRAFPGADVEPRYIITDISMAQADAITRNSILRAYFILALIVLLIIGLLVRQARIIDYATLYARLKQVDQMKDDFVSMAAHELRSPLTIIRGYVEMLGEGEGLTDAGKGHLKNIEMAASQLNSLIGDILDVSRLQEGRMSFKLEPREVSPDIAAVVDSFVRPAQDKGLALSYEQTPLPFILIDPDRFRQVLINLVGNAIKYTPAGSVTVSIAVENDRVSIRVSDTGMGISADEQQKLFQKFYRVKNEETKLIVGTGLGLWITSAIVKQMNGTIAVESIKGKGTDFIVSFPVVRAGEAK